MATMKPVRIKYYGVIWMTKRTYLFSTAIAAAVALLLLLIVIVLGAVPELRFPWDPALAGRGILPRIYNAWVLGALIVLELVDIAVVLGKFAQKEASQRQVANEAE
jgi:hypothetical protein